MATRTITLPAGTDQLSDPSHSAVHGGHAGGWLGYNEVASNQGTFTSEVDLTGLSTTVNVPAGRRLKITAQALFSSTVAGDEVGFNIYEDATRLQTTRHLIGGTGLYGHPLIAVEVPAAGAHTYKATASRAAGSGAITMSAAGNRVAFFLVEDIGSA